MLPAVMLRSMVMGNLDKGNTDLEIAKSIEFVVCSVSEDQSSHFQLMRVRNLVHK